MNEKAWAGQVEQLLKLYGWRYYHTHNSQHSVAGFPDYVCVRDGEIFYAELKTEKGKVSRAQEAWIDALITTGQEVHIWRPSDFEAVHDRLKRRATAR